MVPLLDLLLGSTFHASHAGGVELVACVCAQAAARKPCQDGSKDAPPFAVPDLDVRQYLSKRFLYVTSRGFLFLASNISDVIVNVRLM